MTVEIERAEVEESRCKPLRAGLAPSVRVLRMCVWVCGWVSRCVPVCDGVCFRVLKIV